MMGDCEVRMNETQRLRKQLAESQRREAELFQDRLNCEIQRYEFQLDNDRLRDFIQTLHDATLNQSLQLLCKQALAKEKT